jgi:hypothetical protein
VKERTMAKGMKAFEQSKFDVEKKGEKEGSPADLARDRRQAKAAGFLNKGGKVPRGFAKGKARGR